MTWYLVAPVYYLNQKLFVISGVMWHAPEITFTGNADEPNPWNEFENFTLKILATLPMLDKMAVALEIIFKSPWYTGGGGVTMFL